MSSEEFAADLRPDAGDDRAKVWQTPCVAAMPVDETAAYVVGDHVDLEWGDPFLS